MLFQVNNIVIFVNICQKSTNFIGYQIKDQCALFDGSFSIESHYDMELGSKVFFKMKNICLLCNGRKNLFVEIILSLSCMCVLFSEHS